MASYAKTFTTLLGWFLFQQTIRLYLLVSLNYNESCTLQTFVPFTLTRTRKTADYFIWTESLHYFSFCFTYWRGLSVFTSQKNFMVSCFLQSFRKTELHVFEFYENTLIWFSAWMFCFWCLIFDEGKTHPSYFQKFFFHQSVVLDLLIMFFNKSRCAWDVEA